MLKKITGIHQSLWGEEKFSKLLYDEDSYWRVFVYIIGNPLKHNLVKDLNELENYKHCNYGERLKESDKESLHNLILENQKFDFETDEAWKKLYGSAEETTKVGQKLFN